MSARRARAVIRLKILVADEIEQDLRAWARNVRETARCLRSLGARFRRPIRSVIVESPTPEPVLSWSTGKGSYDETRGTLEEWSAMAWDDLWQVTLRGVGCVRRGTLPPADVVPGNREKSRAAAESSLRSLGVRFRSEAPKS